MNKKNLVHFYQSRLFSVFQAFFVTMLWSSSWVLIKIGLEELPPLFFAGVRYTISSLFLLILVFLLPNNKGVGTRISKKLWLKLVLYGLIFYTITQGAQFVGIHFLPAITVSMLYSFTPVIVVLFSALFLKEKSSIIQVGLVFFSIIGVILYFNPFHTFENSNLFIIGVIVVSFGVIANALATILGRHINRSKQLSPLVVTAISMTIGSIVLLLLALIIEKLPEISVKSILIILWLSVVNTAFAFTLWNKAMQKLRAIEIIMINNTMLAQITILAVIFLGEQPIIMEWIGLSIVGISAFLVQAFRKNGTEESKYSEIEEKRNEKE
ncbi:MAG: DMT family transporter [Candidatus Heimdallarchaeaceae archaeon]